MTGHETNDFPDSRFDSLAVARLRAAFEVSCHPMLFADDGRRLVTANAAACALLGINTQEVPWRRMDEFVHPSERSTIDARWEALLASGAGEGWFQLSIPDRGSLRIEFSTTANVLPGRHLAVLMTPDDAFSAEAGPALARDAEWKPVPAEGGGRLALTAREREVLTLVAGGLETGEIAERLFVAPDTVKSHVHGAMVKLGAHTRARAVAIALVSGQIPWEL